MIYTLTYELRTPNKEYTDMYTYLEKKFGDSAIHVLRDTWWIHTLDEKAVDEMCDDIKKYMGENDVFYITEISEQPINGWLASSSWKWFQDKKGNTTE